MAGGRRTGMLRGVPGVRALLAAPDLAAAIDRLTAEIDAQVVRLDVGLDEATGIGGAALETLNAAMVRLKDALWAIHRDRLRTAAAVAALARPGAGPAAIEAFTSIQVALSALDRLEVRGRDSAGIHLLVTDHGLDLDTTGIRALLEPRAPRPPVPLGRRPHAGGSPQLRLQGRGRDRRARRQRPPPAAGDRRRRSAASRSQLADGQDRGARSHAVGERRHHLRGQRPSAELRGGGSPRRSRSLRRRRPQRRRRQLRRSQGGRLARHRGRGHHRRQGHPDPRQPAPGRGRRPDRGVPAHGRRLRGLGRHRRPGGRRPRAAAARAARQRPGPVRRPRRRRLRRGQRAVRPRRGDLDAICAWTARRRPTPTTRPPAGARSSLLDGDRAGSLAGIRRIAYDGTELPVTDDDLTIGPDHDARHRPRRVQPLPPQGDRRGARLVPQDAARQARRDATAASMSGSDPRRCPTRSAPPWRRGTSAGSSSSGRGPPPSPASRWPRCWPTWPPTPSCWSSAQPATELSGFGLRPDMSDTLVVAISQSGTTTDTNRTVDLVRSRGARVIAIVNRRNSDLTDKADGVLYTSDGRDVEMSVPSTKAFYAQVAAGCLLAVAIADRRRRPPGRPRPVAGRAAPPARGHGRRCSPCGPRSRPSPTEFAPSQRYWAVVGNGPNRIAAQELRIKLSELCYKSIACDIDRGQEAHRPVGRAAHPRVRRRAHRVERRRRRQGGRDLPGPQGDADRDRHRGRGPLRRSALAAINVPATHPRLAFVLSAMAGHLFGYEAALAIDAQALPLREARAAIETADLGATAAPTGPICCTAWCPSSNRSRPGSSTACAAGSVRRPPRGQHRGAPVVAAPLRPRAHAPRRLPGRVRQDRHARRRRRRPHRRTDPGHRGADPTDRRHQAPGQDGHRRHHPHRRDAAAGRRWCSGHRHRRGPRPAHATGRCAPWPPSTRRSRRSPAGSATRSTATRTTATS